MSKSLVKRKNKTTGLYKYKSKGKLHSISYEGNQWQRKNGYVATEIYIDWENEQLKIFDNSGETHILHISMLEPLSVLLNKVRKDGY